MSVDVEDWYQVSDFEEVVDFSAWDSYESRVLRNTERVLELCDASGVKGTFFVLTWKSAIYALLAAVFSVVAFAAIAVLLSPIGMPALTAPFVLTTWLFLWPKAGFRALAPVALADVTTAENIRASYRVRAAGPSATSEPGEAT